MARSMLLGAALGLGTRLVFHGPTELLWIHKVGVPWLAAAFVVGALRPTWRSGAVHGAVALVTAVVVYYESPVAQVGANNVGLGWVWIAIPGGAAFGGLGALWRREERWRLPATALLVGAFLGEAMLWYRAADHWSLSSSTRWPRCCSVRSCRGIHSASRPRLSRALSPSALPQRRLLST